MTRAIRITAIAAIVGSLYGTSTVHASMSDNDSCRDVKEIEDVRVEELERKAKDFEALGFGGGYGAVISLSDRTRVKEAEIVNGLVRITKDQDVHFGPMLELHKFVFTMKSVTIGTIRDSHKLGIGPAQCVQGSLATIPLIGYGPFVGLRLGTEEIVESFAAGIMFGFRTAGSDKSLNLGIAYASDPNARTLGDGIEEGKALPAGETAIRYRTGNQDGLMVLFSVGW